MEIQLTKRFRAVVRKLSADNAAAVDAALEELLVTFGRPHLHVGASVRTIRPAVYELRASLALRIIFTQEEGVLKVDFVGDHDAVRRYLRNMR